MRAALLSRLRRIWNASWHELGLRPLDDSLFVQLAARYLERHRAYHTLRHLEECFAVFESVRGLCAHAGEVQLALFFHDAVYDTRASGNEEQSAEWAQRAIAEAGGAPEVAVRVRALVLATRHAAVPASADAGVMVDVDLSILGADPARFDEYERQVRMEYAWVPDAIFRSERARLLREFLARPSIYTTSALRDRLEARARANLLRSLDALER